MALIVRLQQSNNVAFRAQLLRDNEPEESPRYLLWIAESSDQIYTVNFTSILAADLYAEKENEAYQAILLLKDEDEEGNVSTSTIEVGHFEQNTGVAFLSWLQTTLQAVPWRQ